MRADYGKHKTAKTAGIRGVLLASSKGEEGKWKDEVLGGFESGIRMVNLGSYHLECSELQRVLLQNGIGGKKVERASDRHIRERVC